MVAAGLVVALAAAVLGARHASPSEVSPVSPAHQPWHAMWTWGVVAAFVLYVAGTWLARGGAYSLRTAIVVAVVVQVIALAAPLLLSKDVYLYWAEARILAVHHANPYRATPSDYPGDPAHAYVSEIWLTEKEPYGTAWSALGRSPPSSPARPPGAPRSPTACSRCSASSPRSSSWPAGRATQRRLRYSGGAPSSRSTTPAAATTTLG